MPVFDKLGNELRVGDTVCIEMPSPVVTAKVTDIREGGVSLMVRGGDPNQITPGLVESQAVIFTQFDPRPGRSAIPNIIKAHQPAKKEEKPAAGKLVELPN